MDIEIREFITYLHNTKKHRQIQRSHTKRSEKMAEFHKNGTGIRN